jgi:hypothetical protein
MHFAINKIIGEFLALSLTGSYIYNMSTSTILPVITIIGGREAFLKSLPRGRYAVTPKEKFWDSYYKKLPRTPGVHPWRLGCACATCEEQLHRLRIYAR